MENTPCRENRPNILWICTDQQRFDTLGCMGNHFVRTPHLDWLSTEGATFENCYTQSPVCAPSRGAFLTGRYPRTCGMRQNGSFIFDNEVLLPKILSNAGYTCGLVGKLHLAPCHPSVCRGMEKRIDDGYSWMCWSHQDGGSPIVNEYKIWLMEKGKDYKSTPRDDCPYVENGMPEELHHTTFCFEKAFQFMKTCQDAGNPFFLSLNCYDPHNSLNPPEEYLARYLEHLDEIELPNYCPGELDGKPVFQMQDHTGEYGHSNGHPYKKKHPYDSMTEFDHRMQRAAYWAMVDLIDAQAGKLFRKMRESGMLDNTLIIFMSDHGEMLGDHGIYQKGPFFYDCAVKVPLIFRYPEKIPAGLRSAALVELIDLPQTILDFCGLPAHPGMMGKSLYPILTGQADPSWHHDSVYCEYLNAMNWHQCPDAFCTMLFDGRYKIVSAHGTGTGEIYDLKEDPTETNNLWNHPACVPLKMELLGKLCDRIAFTCDPLPERIAVW